MTGVARYHAWSTVAAFIGALLVSVASEAPLLGLIACPVIALSWFMYRRSARSPIPRWLFNAIVVAAGLNLARQLMSRDHQVQDSIARLSEFVVVLLAVKMLESRRIRDQMQAIALGGMAAIGATLTSVTLTVGALTAVYLIAALNTVVLFQFVRIEAAARGTSELWDTTVSDPTNASDATWLRPLRWTLAAAAPVLCAGAIVVFLMMPRDLAKNLLAPWHPRTSSATTGFADEVQLGFSGVITESDDIVMEVTIEVGDRTRIFTDPQYFRGAVLDHYDADRGRWRRGSHAAERDRLRQFGDASDPSNRTTLDRASLVRQRINIRGRTTDHLFAMLTPIWGRTTDNTPIRPNDVDGTIRLELGRGADRYEVVSNPMAAVSLISRSDRDDEFFRTGPVQEYAAEILRRRRLERDPDALTSIDDERRVEVFRQHLASLCEYSLELQAPPPGTDATEWFILEHRRGSCEYFASALAAMCRSVGIEARMVTGYITNEADETSGRYIVRSRHAHAWVEALVPMPGSPVDPDTDAPTRLLWRTFDATPMANTARTMGNAGNFLAQLRRMFERLEGVWVNSFITFDGARQAEVLGPTLSPTGWLNTIFERLSRANSNRSARVVATATVFAIAFACTSGLLLGFRWLAARRLRAARTHRVRHATQGHGARASARILARLDRALRRAGSPRPAWRGAVEHAASLTSTHPSAGPIADRIARACYAVRFGNGDPARLAQAGADLRALGAALAADKHPRARAR